MISFYLNLNAFLYFLFSIWCFIKFSGTSRFLGYDFLNNSGRIEYFTIYGGLQMGFAIFLVISGYFQSLRLSGLLFCVAIYICIIITRTASALYYGNLTKATYLVGALEYSLAIWGSILLFNHLKPIN